jgi:hypothetical protein
MDILDLESLHSFQFSQHGQPEIAHAFPYFYCTHVSGDTYNAERVLTTKTHTVDLLWWENYHILRSVYATYGYYAREACMSFIMAAGMIWAKEVLGRKRSIGEIADNPDDIWLRTLKRAFKCFNLYTRSASFVEDTAELLYFIEGVGNNSLDNARESEERILGDREPEFVAIYHSLKNLHAMYKGTIESSRYSSPTHHQRRPIDWLEAVVDVALAVKPLPNYNDLETCLMDDTMFSPRARIKRILAALDDSPHEFLKRVNVASSKISFETCSGYLQQLLGDTESRLDMLNFAIDRGNIRVREPKEVLEPASSFLLMAVGDVKDWSKTHSQTPRGWTVIISDGSRRVMAIRSNVDKHLVESGKKALCLAQFGLGLLNVGTQEEVAGCFFEDVSNFDCELGRMCPYRITS